MKKEEFTALGISEELAEKAAAESKKELEQYISKEQYTESENVKKELEKQIKDRDKQLKDLKGKVGDNEELKAQLEQMEAVNKQVKEEYETKIKDLKLDAAITETLSSSKYPDLLAGKIDRSKLILTEDGTVAGMEEQIKTLKENYKELFITENQAAGATSATGAKNISGGYTPKAGATHKEGIGSQMAAQRNETEKSNAGAGLWGAE